jgi:hypothetical protein
MESFRSIFLIVMETHTLTHPIAERLTGLIEELMTYVQADVWTAIEVITLFLLRLGRLKRRFVSIMARYRAGTLEAPGRARRPAVERTIVGWEEKVVLSTRWGSLLAITRTVIPGYELEKMVDSAELEALYAEVPQIGRVLRPLCHMLAVRMPAWLRLPRKPRRRVKKEIPPAPDYVLADPDAMLRPDGTVWMHMGSSRHWKPGRGETLEEARKFDPPQRIWPR